MTDKWANGQLYEPYVGRWSKLVAADFISWLRVPPKKRWLDVGCGTGALTRMILDLSSPMSVKGIDPSEGYITFAREIIRNRHVAFDIGTVESLQLSDDSMDVVVSGLVLNFVPDPVRTVTEMKRLTLSGGIVAAYVWDYADKMELMRYFWDAAITLDQDAINLDEGIRFPLCKPEPLRALFTSAGLHNVQVRPVDVPTRFENFEDYWTPFLGGQAPAPGYAMSLPERRRTELREQIRSTLPIEKDGSMNLSARAWAIKGVKL